MLGGVCYTEFESHMRKFAWGGGYVVEKVFGVVSKTPESFFKPCVYKMLWCCSYMVLCPAQCVSPGLVFLL